YEHSQISSRTGANIWRRIRSREGQRSAISGPSPGSLDRRFDRLETVVAVMKSSKFSAFASLLSRPKKKPRPDVRTGRAFDGVQSPSGRLRHTMRLRNLAERPMRRI